MPSPTDIFCSVPGGVQVCDLVGAGHAAGTAVAHSALNEVAAAAATGFGNVIELMSTFWVYVPTPELSSDSGPVAALRTDLGWITGAVAVGGILFAAGRMMWSRSSKPAVQLAMGLGRLIFASFVLLPAIVLVTQFGDTFSTWVINRSNGARFGGTMAGITAGLAAIDPWLLFIIGAVGAFSGLVQIAFMLLRLAVLIVLAGVIPTLAASSMTETGEHAYKKALHWLFGFTIYKPAAALVYAGAFLSIGKGGSVMEVLAGLTLIIVAVIALPALLKLVHPAADAVIGMTEGAAQRHASSVNDAGAVARSVASGATKATKAASGAAASMGTGAAAAGGWAVQAVRKVSSTRGTG